MGFAPVQDLGNRVEVLRKRLLKALCIIYTSEVAESEHILL